MIKRLQKRLSHYFAVRFAPEAVTHGYGGYLDLNPPPAFAQCSVLNEVFLGRSCVLTMHESYYHLPSDLRPPLAPSKLIAISDPPGDHQKRPRGIDRGAGRGAGGGEGPLASSGRRGQGALRVESHHGVFFRGGGPVHAFCPPRTLPYLHRPPFDELHEGILKNRRWGGDGELLA